MDALDGLKIETALAAQSKRDEEENETGQMDFLTMLVAQLENQDPLNPQDSAEFAAQLAQFSTVEQLIAMRQGIDELVASAKAPTAEGSSAAASLDPASLVGRDVTVFGSQIEVDAVGQPVEVDLRSIDAALEANVRIVDANGETVLEESILPRNADGESTYLPAGDHVYRLDPRERGLPAGVYGIEFEAIGQGGEAVTLLPMINGRVTGAVVAGEPSIRIGGRLFPVTDVLEIRLAESAARSTGGSGDPGATGGGQSVFFPEPTRAPTRVAP